MAVSNELFAQIFQLILTWPDLAGPLVDAATRELSRSELEILGPAVDFRHTRLERNHLGFSLESARPVTTTGLTLILATFKDTIMTIPNLAEEHRPTLGPAANLRRRASL